MEDGVTKLSLQGFREIERLARALPSADSGFEINTAIEWQQTVQAPADSDIFAREAIFVICNSGMKHTVARRIHDRVIAALSDGASASTVFGHKGKAAAIDTIWRHRADLFARFLLVDGDYAKLDFLGALPWIGGITKFHLAKNFGVDVAKPDVHLGRLAVAEGSTVHDMCARLARETGYRVATVDLILWFACARGVVNSRAASPFEAFP